jgi:hypothetical protein
MTVLRVPFALIFSLTGCTGSASGADECDGQGRGWETVWASPVTGECLDTLAAPSSVEICLEYAPDIFFRCAQSQSSGEQLWFAAPGAVVATTDWAPCDSPASLPPSCEFPACATEGPNGLNTSPYSNCAGELMRDFYSCGGSLSVWDEACCMRAFCDNDASCEEGEVCRRDIFSGQQKHCWVLSDAAGEPVCICTENFEDPATNRCFPAESVPSP